MPAFIETQFPIARLSAESYKERKANNGQTLTRLGKWWGRKPLILVRASILGMLMPSSSDPKRDREIFLKILTMDDDGVWEREKGASDVPEWVPTKARSYGSRAAFDALPYAERIAYCERPENVEGPSPMAWAEINAHLGSNRSGFWRQGTFQRCDRNDLKARVRSGELRILLGTDAASEGLNLQKLGTLINIDLPWNPTRLEQRKGRIQRIGQVRSEVWIANLRYRDSVEDRVHQVLADRLEAIHELFGQIPDTLEDVWVQIALKDEAAAEQLIDRTTATRNPFDIKYSKVEDADWETCSAVLNKTSVRELMSSGWKSP